MVGAVRGMIDIGNLAYFDQSTVVHDADALKRILRKRAISLTSALSSSDHHRRLNSDDKPRRRENALRAITWRS